MVKKAVKPSLIEHLLGLEPEIQEEIETNPSDIIRTPLLNIRGDLSHLRDALQQVESWERPDA